MCVCLRVRACVCTRACVRMRVYVYDVMYMYTVCIHMHILLYNISSFIYSILEVKMEEDIRPNSPAANSV